MESSHSHEKKIRKARRVAVAVAVPHSLLKEPAKRIRTPNRFGNAKRVSTICPCCSDHKCTIHN